MQASVRGTPAGSCEDEDEETTVYNRMAESKRYLIVYNAFGWRQPKNRPHSPYRPPFTPMRRVRFSRRNKSTRATRQEEWARATRNGGQVHCIQEPPANQK